MGAEAGHFGGNCGEKVAFVKFLDREPKGDGVGYDAFFFLVNC